MSFTDFRKLSILSKMTTIVHHDGRQFIGRCDVDDGGLPYSAEFYLNGEVWKLSGEDCFLMSPRRYISKVTVEGTVDLDTAVGFEEAVQTLLKHLKVVKVLLDEELDECNKTKSVLVMILDKLADESGENIDRKRDVMLLGMLLKKHGNSLNMDFKYDLKSCLRLSSEIMSTLDNYVTKALKLIQRNEIFGHLNDSLLSTEFISNVIQEALNRRRARLAAVCPSTMKNKLKELPDDRILYVTMEDMHLFTGLTTLDKAIFKAVLPKIFSKFLARVEEINDDQFRDLDPLSNRIFLYVCKSVQDVAKQLGTHIAITYSEALGWEETKFQTSPNKCLRQQLQMLTLLANHFEPGGPFRTSRFPYEFKLFQNMDAIPEPVRIWLCLLDDCMKDLVQADLDKMQMFSCFFTSYVSFIASEDFRSETLECLRTITRDALRSLADMTSSQHDRTTSDSVSLEYNKMIRCCVDKFLRELSGHECDQIETTLQQIICKAMDMNVSSDELSMFSNVFNQLLNDLSDLQLEWFIRLPPSNKRSLLLENQFIVPVENTDYRCFLVVDLKGFVEMYKLLHSSEKMPKHYQLQVILVLLQNLETLAAKPSWKDGKRLSDKELLGAMTVMTNSIRSSLVLLNVQPNYVSFEDYLRDRVELTKMWNRNTYE
ncbi:uncharacterized protein LOC135707556 [Ochlerotatus camptorhynchus]|uniref:uncharacterized protein LOC135707556 n=1 Tax=Ochlerotatus camptorhynchus TaxID=644619 RepID=UPI0031D18E61